MKLLIISSWFPYPPDNGSKQRAFALLRELSRNHQLTLISFREDADAQAEPLRSLCASIETVPGNPFKPQRPLQKTAFLSSVPRSYAQTYSERMQALVDGHLNDHDLAVAFQIGAAIYLRGRSSVPRLLEEAEVGVIREQFTSNHRPLPRLRSGATWFKYARFIKALVAECDRATVVSEIEREHLGDAGCDLAKVRVLPNGTDVPPAPLRVIKKPMTLIYPGSVTYSANLDAVRYFLTDIWPTIRQAQPSAQFMVTGSTSGVDLAQLPHRDGVVFTGHVANIDEAIAESSVCVVPLRLGGGTRLKILQSMALGTPVVSTSKGAEGLDVRDGRDILLGDSPETFSAQVLRLLCDRALEASLSSEGRDLVGGRYAWPVIGRQLEALLAETMAAFTERQVR
jgi:glycosyltransferase involved in cell wall biosynthesis